MKVKSKKMKRSYKHHAERRDEIVTTAERLFYKNGFASTGIKKVMQAVGISYATFYYHFPSKQDLVRAFAERGISKYLKAIESWREDGQLTPQQQLRQLLEMVYRLRKIRVGIAKLRGGTQDEDPLIYEVLVSRIHEDMGDAVAGILRTGVDNGDFTVEEPKATAILICMMVFDQLHFAGSADNAVKWPRMRETLERSIARVLSLPPEALFE